MVSLAGRADGSRSPYTAPPVEKKMKRGRCGSSRMPSRRLRVPLTLMLTSVKGSRAEMATDAWAARW